MRFICRNQNFRKQFSTKFNSNKHERIKGRFEESKPSTRKIPHDPSTNLYSCPTIGCKTTSKYKQNFLKHLKSCSQVNVIEQQLKKIELAEFATRHSQKNQTKIVTFKVSTTVITLTIMTLVTI